MITRYDPEIKQGNRVVAVGRIDGNFLDGECGTVIAIRGSCCVQFDNPIYHGHDGDCKGKPGHCWWCDREHLILIDCDCDEADFDESESVTLTEFIQSFVRG